MTTDPLKSNDLHIEYLPVAALKPYAQNARTHSEKQIRQIAESIRNFGFTNPVLIDRADSIIAGHGRVEAARKLGFDKVPAIRLEHLTDDQKRAYIIADNRLAELAGWDNDILAIELQYLLTVPEFNISLTGFEPPQIDIILQGVSVHDDDEEEVDIDESLPVVTKPGYLWQLGDHLIACGNALDPEIYRHLLKQEKAQIIITDPPYNVPIRGHVSGLGKIQHQEFAMASGEMTEAEFTGFLKKALQQCAAWSEDGSIHFVFMDWRHAGELLTAGKETYAELKNICVWNKDNGGMGSLYRSKHEFIFVFKHGKAPHINNIELGQHGRYRTNVWDYPGQTSLHANRQDELAMHPTPKPAAMIADAILDCSHRNGLVFDPFSGSGTALLAAEKTGRRARLIEIDPSYVDVTIRRWAKLTGKQAVHVESGKTFGTLSQEAPHVG